MSSNTVDHRNIKDLSIDTLEIAECNLLMSIKGIYPEDVNKQIIPDVNPIAWIFGHCADHMDSVFGAWCQGERIFNEDFHTLFSYGAAKGTIKEELPLPFGKIVSNYLQISDKCFSYLKVQSIEKYQQVPGDPTQRNESLMQVIQRVALHYMGHMGQIIAIRRALKNPGESFVTGMDQEPRKKYINDWKAWWEENKTRFE